MSYRDDVDALAARHAALEHELADAARTLDEARAAQNRVSLPVLDNLRIASPCRASWDRMLGDDRVRHCNDCNKNVFNLSAMTRDQAEALIRAKNGDLCARYFQRADGTILLSDCTVGTAQRNKRRLVAAGAFALLAGTSGAAIVQNHKTNHFTMGAVRVDTSMRFAQPPVVTHAPLTEVLGGSAASPPPVEPVLMGKISAPKKL